MRSIWPSRELVHAGIHRNSPYNYESDRFQGAADMYLYHQMDIRTECSVSNVCQSVVCLRRNRSCRSDHMLFQFATRKRAQVLTSGPPHGQLLGPMILIIQSWEPIYQE
jgi:hypothetical protein